MLVKLKNLIKNYFDPDELTLRKRRHDRGDCPKELGGYNCKGSNNYKECGE